MTLQEVKTLIRRTEGFTEADNQFIMTMIPIVEAYVMKKCGLDSIPNGLKLAIAKIIEYEMANASISSKSMMDVRLQYRDQYPQSVQDLLDEYRVKKVRIV